MRGKAERLQPAFDAGEDIFQFHSGRLTESHFFALSNFTVDCKVKLPDSSRSKQAEDIMLRSKTAWTTERIARLGFLVGQGLAAKRIAADPLIASTPNNVHRQAQRFGLAFRESMATTARLPPEAAARYDAAAAKRGVTREAVIRLLLLVAADEPNLLDNILDDEA
jgi:hypothetical protein